MPPQQRRRGNTKGQSSAKDLNESNQAFSLDSLSGTADVDMGPLSHEVDATNKLKNKNQSNNNVNRRQRRQGMTNEDDDNEYNSEAEAGASRRAVQSLIEERRIQREQKKLREENKQLSPAELKKLEAEALKNAAGLEAEFGDLDDLTVHSKKRNNNNKSNNKKSNNKKREDEEADDDDEINALLKRTVAEDSDDAPELLLYKRGTANDTTSFSTWLIRILLIGGLIFLLKLKLESERLDRLGLDLSEEDPLTVLGVSWGASKAEVRAAYRRLSIQFHPDKHPECGEPCVTKFARINKAFERYEKEQSSNAKNSNNSQFVKQLTDANAVTRVLENDSRISLIFVYSDAERSGTAALGKFETLAEELRGSVQCFSVNALRHPDAAATLPGRFRIFPVVLLVSPGNAPIPLAGSGEFDGQMIRREMQSMLQKVPYHSENATAGDVQKLNIDNNEVSLMLLTNRNLDVLDSFPLPISALFLKFKRSVFVHIAPRALAKKLVTKSANPAYSKLVLSSAPWTAALVNTKTSELIAAVDINKTYEMDQKTTLLLSQAPAVTLTKTLAKSLCSRNAFYKGLCVVPTSAENNSFNAIAQVNKVLAKSALEHFDNVNALSALLMKTDLKAVTDDEDAVVPTHIQAVQLDGALLEYAAALASDQKNAKIKFLLVDLETQNFIGLTEESLEQLYDNLEYLKMNPLPEQPSFIKDDGVKKSIWNHVEVYQIVAVFVFLGTVIKAFSVLETTQAVFVLVLSSAVVGALAHPAVAATLKKYF